MFWPKFFEASAPEFLESIYKNDTGSDHGAKFRGDRPRELGDYALKKRKTSRVKQKTSRTTVPGGLKISSKRCSCVEIIVERFIVVR